MVMIILMIIMLMAIIMQSMTMLTRWLEREEVVCLCLPLINRRFGLDALSLLDIFFGIQTNIFLILTNISYHPKSVCQYIFSTYMFVWHRSTAGLVWSLLLLPPFKCIYLAKYILYFDICIAQFKYTFVCQRYILTVFKSILRHSKVTFQIFSKYVMSAGNRLPVWFSHSS